MKLRTVKEQLKTTAGILIALTIGFVIFVVVTIAIPAYATRDKIIKVAAIGDSITEGARLSVDEINKKSYPAQLQTLLGDRYKVTNYGLGARSLLSTDLFPYGKENFYKESQAADPDIVLIMLGTNDSSSDHWDSVLYEKELAAFVGVYKNLPSRPKVYLLTVPVAYNPKTETNPETINGTIVRNEVVPAILRVAKTTRTPVIDIYAATKDHLDLLPDGIHPNTEGYKLIAEKVYEIISR